MGADDLITTEAQLAAIYGQPSPVAVLKEIDHIIPEYARFIEAAPFLVVATNGPEGLDCSPRGDPNGFVRIQDQKTLLIPDRRGNNRLDALRNIVRDPRIALLFMVPGHGITMRVNGRAAISVEKALCESFAMRGNPANCVIVVTIEAIYPQCPKALVRSRLWDATTQIPRDALPTIGDMIRAIDPTFEAASYDAGFPARMAQTLY